MVAPCFDRLYVVKVFSFGLRVWGVSGSGLSLCYNNPWRLSKLTLLRAKENRAEK